MLNISADVIDAMAQGQRPRVAQKMAATLREMFPALVSYPDLDAHVLSLADWAEAKGIGLYADILMMAEWTFGRRIQVTHDPDFQTIVDAMPPPREHVMLRYLEAKPPDFWRTGR